MIQSRLHQKLINVLVISKKKKFLVISISIINASTNLAIYNLTFGHVTWDQLVITNNLQPHIWTSDMGPITKFSGNMNLNSQRINKLVI